MVPEENEEYAELQVNLRKEERAPRKRAIVKRARELQEKAWSASSLAERIRKDREDMKSNKTHWISDHPWTASVLIPNELYQLP